MGEALTLPADDVGHHVHLGFANTIHGAQRATVDTTHTMLAGTETWQALYVAVSRGRHENHLYLSDGEPALDGFAVEMPADYGPREVLSRILERDDHAVSATRAGSVDPARELVRATQQYVDALPLLAENVMGDPKMRALDSAFEHWMPGVSSQPGYPGLRGQIALRWVDCESPDEIPRQATWWQDGGGAPCLPRLCCFSGSKCLEIRARAGRDRSSVLASAAPDALRNHPDAGPYIDRTTCAIDDLAVAANQDAALPLQLESRLSAAQRHHDR